MTQSAQIDTLLFDLGGVIIDLTIDKAKAGFGALGMPDPDGLLDPFVQKGLFAKIESGQISPETFFDSIRDMLPEDKRQAATDKAITDVFCRFLHDLPPSRLRALHELSSRYRVALLSNTNPIMWHTRIAELFTADGHDRDYYFPAGMVTSFEAGVMKPEPEIFRYAIKKLGLNPATTLFLDDGPANVEAARNIGFQAALVPEGKEFSDILCDYGI